MIGWEGSETRNRPELLREIGASAAEGRSLNDAVRLIRQAEEIRLGLLFLQKKLQARDIMRGLSRTAEAVLASCLGSLGEDARGLGIAGFGKLGGREITFNSDLDVIFISRGEPSDAATKAAERLLRMLISYTKEGIAYRVDTRLRPEGSRGPLVSSVESLRKYYAASAAGWEMQALLKARPVAGDPAACSEFIQMARGTLSARGKEVTPGGIRQMRDRIVKELGKEAEGYDVKLGPGGIEDLEFMVQYLQLANAKWHPSVLAHATLHAVRQLGRCGIMESRDAEFAASAYLFYREIESLLRLRGETVLKRDSERLQAVAEFLNFGDAAGLLRHLELTREKARSVIEKYLG